MQSKKECPVTKKQREQEKGALSLELAKIIRSAAEARVKVEVKRTRFAGVYYFLSAHGYDMWLPLEGATVQEMEKAKVFISKMQLDHSED